MSSNIYASLLLFSWLVKGLSYQFARQLTQILRPLETLAPSYFTGYGSLAIFKQLPPEVLEEIFVHTCGDEYIAFFNHFSLPLPNSADIRDITRINTVYTLKAVCKEWKNLAERTPKLWQRIHFNFDDFWIEYGLFRSVQHFANMTKHVLLARSAGMGLHIQIRGQSFPRDQLDVRSRMQYFVPLMYILAEEGHRWSSIDFHHVESRYSDTNSAMYPTLAHVMANSSFPNLRFLIYHSPPTSHPAVTSLQLNLSSSAPLLTNLILRGGNFRMLNGTSPSLRCRWHNLTSPVIDPEGCLSSWLSAVEELLPVLQAVRRSLARLHWRGSSVFDIGGHSEQLLNSKTYIELEGLRELVLEDSTALQLCHALLPRLSCPILQKFELLLCSPVAAPGTSSVEGLPWRLSALTSFLASAPLLKICTILQVPDLPHYAISREKPHRDNKHIHHGYVVLGGSLLELRQAIVHSFATQPDLSLSDLFAHDADMLKRDMLAKAMRFIPYAAYSPIPIRSRMTERPRLMPPRVMTAWEEGPWSEDHSEIDNVRRLLDFAHYLSLKCGMERGGDCNPMIRALNAMDDASMTILVHLLEMTRGYDNRQTSTIPGDCTVTLSVAI